VIKTCIIGVSGYGRIHYDMLLAAQAAGEVEIVGAAIINQDEEPEKCARLQELGCRIFDDYHVMLNDLSGVAEFCMIPTGTPLHRPMTVAALEAGMHVLVEKPAAGCLEDVRAMQGAAKKAGKMVAVGYQHMYAPVAMATKKVILDGEIGTVESIKCLVMWPRDHDYYTRNGWAGKLTANGMAVNDSPFNNAVAHDLMMSLFLAGATQRDAAMPTSVDAELYRANAIESTDTASILVETAEGVPIRFYATHACQERFGPEIHIRGTLGTIVKTHGDSILTPITGDPRSLVSEENGEARSGMMAVVLDAVQGGPSFICDLETASRQTMVVSMIHESCAIQSVKGETVTPETGPARTFIPVVEEAMRQAFDAEQLLSETGAAWTQ
jgi:predicted dehydrogenase